MSNPFSQTDWYIDPISGKDNRAGNTPATALQTFAKLSSIWGRGNLLSPPGTNGGANHVDITVRFLGSLPDSDPLIFDVILDSNVDLVFAGNDVVSSPVTVTSIIQRDRNTNTPWQFTTGGGLTIGKRIYNSTPTKKTYMWSVKDQGSNIFRISEPLKMPATGFPHPVNDRVTPLPSDTFFIQTLFNVKTGSMRVGSVRTSIATIPRNKLVFKDLNITGDISPEIDMGTQFFCYGCSITGSIQLATGFDRNFVNCCQLPGQTIRPISGLTRFQGGAYIGTVGPVPAVSPGSQGFLPTNCSTQLDMDVIFQGHSMSIVAGNTLIIGTAGIFDSVPGGNGFTNKACNGIMVSAGSVTCRKLQDSEHHLWGSGQIGAGVGVSSGGRFYYVTKEPTITGGPIGNTRDFVLGEYTPTNTTSYGIEFDGDFIGPTPNSWSNLSKPLIGGTGFGGNAVNPKSDAWILKTE